MLFGPDNLGDAAISGFLQKHSCNFCCHRLGLKGTKPVFVQESHEPGNVFIIEIYLFWEKYLHLINFMVFLPWN